MKLTKYKIANYLIITVLFGISVLLRCPRLKSPLTVSHDRITASSLLRMRYWYETPLSQHKFLLFATGKNEGDKGLSWDHIDRDLSDGRGNYYYLSYPPFAFIAPYLVFRIFNIPPDIFPLRIFSLFIHFLCCFLIFLIISMLVGAYYKNKINIPAIMGFAIYLFSWLPYSYHSMRFYSDTFVQVFFIAGIYLFLKIIDNPINKLYLSLFSIVLFFMCYTEWIGFLFAFCVMLYALFMIKKPVMKTLFFLTGVTSIFSLTIILWHYSLIIGFQGFLFYLLEAYKKRCGLVPNVHNEPLLFSKKSWKLLFSTYLMTYKEFILFIYTIVCLSFFTTRFNLNFIKQNKLKLSALYLAFAPVLIHHIALFNLTVIHEFLLLKTGVFLALITGLSYDQVALFLKKHAKFPKIKIGMIVALFIFLNIQAIRIYKTYKVSHSSGLQSIGTQIGKLSNPDEMIFIDYKPNKTSLSFGVGPAACWYAHRNLETWKNRMEAKKLMKINKVKHYVTFKLNEKNSEIINVQRVSI